MAEPLHVQVARALGCKLKKVVYAPGGEDVWSCDCPGFDHMPDEGAYVFRYDTDWAATGPLIEKYGVELHPCVQGYNCSVPDHATTWEATKVIDSCPWDKTGPTPLIAVCNLILALKEAGELP